MDCEVGQPRVNYRETIQARSEFDYLHKKQSGGQVSLLMPRPLVQLQHLKCCGKVLCKPVQRLFVSVCLPDSRHSFMHSSFSSACLHRALVLLSDRLLPGQDTCVA